MGFHIDNLQLVNQYVDDKDGEDQRVLLNTDDASLHSFGDALYGRAGPPGKGGVAQMLLQPNRTGPDPSIGAEAAAPEAMSGSNAT